MIENSSGNQIQLDGDGPFILPFLQAEVSFGFGDNVAIMRMSTTEGQEVLLPFEKKTLRAIGLALADVLDRAFPKETLVSGDLVFVERESAGE